MPKGEERFNRYLQKLQGSGAKGLKAAIMGYNPMAKDHAHQKIKHMQHLEVEQKASTIIDTINTQYTLDHNFKVIINLADDLHGAWSERHATEFDSKFRFEGTFNKGFCTPYFWTSEDITESVAVQRIKEAIYRTIFWLENKGEKNLGYFFNQEVFVCQQSKSLSIDLIKNNSEHLKQFLKTHHSTTEYSKIFNFFYGDEASKKLGYQTHGISSPTGFDLARSKAVVK